MGQTADRYRALLDHLPDGFARHEVVLSEDGAPVDYNFLEVNPAFETLTGLARDQVIGRRITEVLPAIAHSSFDWIAAYGQVAQSGQPITFEQYSEALDHWYEVTAYSDEPGTFITLFHDVTERRRMEEALEDQRMVMEQIHEQMLAGYWDWDIPRGTEYMSPTFKRMFGYEPHEMADVPESWQALAFPEDLPGLLERVTRHFESQGSIPFSYEVRYRHKDGSTMWVICSGRVISWDENGKPLRMIGCHVDITGLKRAESALRGSEERYRRLFQQSMDPIAVISGDGILIDANEPFLRAFGYDRSDLGHLNVRDHYVDPAQRDDFLRHLEADGAVVDHEAKLRRRDGTVMDCIRSSVARKDESGRIIEIQTFCRDITERKKAEQELADELTRRRILLEQSRDGIVVLDQGGGVVEANARFARMLAYSLEEVHQLHVWDWDALHDSETLRAMLSSVDEAGDHFETQHRRKDGTTLDVEISTNGAVFGDRKLIFCVCRDITERKQAEHALRESEEKYRTLFEQSKDAINLTTPDGRVLDANQAFLALFGYSREELVGIHTTTMYAEPHDRARFLEAMAEHGALVDDEVRFRRKDGSVMDCVRNATVLKREDGSVIAFQSVVRDVTHQKRDREELERSHRELQRLNTHLQLVREEERADVAWELHDEVGQALSTVTMDLQALRGKLPSATASAAHDDLERATAQLHETIERIRRLYTDLRPGMLDDLGLAATVEWQATEFSRRSRIPCQITRLDPVELRDEESRLTLYRVFQEALGNAARHSGATMVEVSVTGQDDHVTIRVTDNGRGITDEELTSPSALGLATIRERVQSCNGRLDIRRGEHGGTMVEATVPVVRNTQ